MADTSELGVAIIQDWLVDCGESEKILSALLEIEPERPIYTIAHNSQGRCSPETRGHLIERCFIQKPPGPCHFSQDETAQQIRRLFFQVRDGIGGAA